MGCGLSKRPASRSKEPTDYRPHAQQSDDPLTARQVELITDSWAVIQDDILETGVAIYQTFFKSLEADLLVLFKNVIQNDGGERLLVDDEMLKKHAQMVMDGLGTIVEVMNDRITLNTLTDYLAKVHKKNNVKPHMLMRLWPAIDSSFKSVLMDVYTSQVRAAWKQLIEFLVFRMQERMNSIDDNFEKNDIDQTQVIDL